MANSYSFDMVKELIDLGYDVTTKNDVNLEIKGATNGLNSQLSSRDLSRTTKLIL